MVCSKIILNLLVRSANCGLKQIKENKMYKKGYIQKRKGKRNIDSYALAAIIKQNNGQGMI